MNMMLYHKYQARCTALEALDHPWFTDVDNGGNLGDSQDNDDLVDDDIESILDIIRNPLNNTRI